MGNPTRPVAYRHEKVAALKAASLKLRNGDVGKQVDPRELIQETMKVLPLKKGTLKNFISTRATEAERREFGLPALRR